MKTYAELRKERDVEFWVRVNAYLDKADRRALAEQWGLDIPKEATIDSIRLGNKERAVKPKIQRITIPGPDGEEYQITGTMTLQGETATIKGLVAIPNSPPFQDCSVEVEVELDWREILEIEDLDPAEALLLRAPAHGPVVWTRIDWGILAALLLLVMTLGYFAVMM